MNSEELYKIIDDRITYIMNYYLDYQDYIENFEFPRVDYLFLIKNISIFYKSLNLSKEKINQWYMDNDVENLFDSLICIPKKIIFSKDIYENTVVINRELKRINKIKKINLEKNEKYKETNKQEF